MVLLGALVNHTDGKYTLLHFFNLVCLTHLLLCHRSFHTSEVLHWLFNLAGTLYVRKNLVHQLALQTHAYLHNHYLSRPCCMCVDYIVLMLFHLALALSLSGMCMT